jgi:O-antigen ligase
LIVLGLTSLVATVFSDGNRPALRALLVVPVLGFVVATGLSILLSEDLGRSVRFSAALLPAVLLCVVIAASVRRPPQMRLLYLTWSLVGLGLAAAVLWTGWRTGWAATNALVAAVGSPLLVVANDITLLAVIAPLSVALVVREPRSVVGGVAALSILMSLAAVCLLRSRGALVTMIASITCAAACVRPWRGVAWGVVLVLLALLVDGWRGFPLLAKFGILWDGRLPLWSSAWAMFRDAPLVGHGPHTFRYNGIPWTHNLYLEVLAEQGLLGLGTLGALLASGGTMAWQSVRAVDRETHVLGAGALAGLLGVGVAAFVELSLIRQWVVIMLFTLVGIVAHLSRPNRA